jgi:ParB family chromosome partitioning protein
MAKKRQSIDIEEFFKKEEQKTLTGELFDINNSKGMVNIPMSQLIANPNQPRKTFNEETISELADSIRQHGLLSPIIIRPRGRKYEIIAGERRYKAAVQAGLKEVPAIIKKASDKESRVISLIENIQREDLNDIDRASALSELKASLKLSWDDIAQRLSLTKRRIMDLVGLLDLPDEIKDSIRDKILTERHGRALRKILDRGDILKDVFKFVIEKKLTGEQTLELVQSLKSEPRFTIEEAFEKTSGFKNTGIREKKNEQDLLLGSLKKFTGLIIKFKKSGLAKEKRAILIEMLIESRSKIDNLIEELKVGKR